MYSLLPVPAALLLLMIQRLCCDYWCWCWGGVCLLLACCCCCCCRGRWCCLLMVRSLRVGVAVGVDVVGTMWGPDTSSVVSNTQVGDDSPHSFCPIVVQFCFHFFLHRLSAVCIGHV